MKSLEPMYAALSELNLTENEQRLYILSLQNGPTTISVLAEQLGLPRPNLYKIINGLYEKGLVDESMQTRRKKRFMVEAPSKISELLKTKRDTQKSVDHSFIEQLPSYLAQFQQGEGPMKVKMLVGQKDFMQAFNQMYEETKEELWYFGSVTDLSKAVTRTMIDQNVGQRINRKIRTKALLLPTDRDYLTKKQHKDQLRDVRYLKNMSPFITSFHIFANKLVLWQPNAPMAVLIEDEYLVSMMRSMFTELWSRGQE